MRAFSLLSQDGPLSGRITEVPEPVGAHAWSPDERLVVDVRAAGVSFPDLLQSYGRYQHKWPLPVTLGSEFAGVVREVSPGSRFAIGDRVAGLTMHGALAEQVLAIPRYTMKLPDTTTWLEGAALFLNYATAWFALRRGGFAAGDAVVVHGAAGGVGTALLDLLRLRSESVIGVVSTDRKAAVAIGAGATHVARSDDDWLAKVRDITGGRGVDLVFDPVGGDRVIDSLRALDLGGRLVTIGFAGGDSVPSVPLNRLLLKDLSVVGVALEPWVRRHPAVATELVDDLETMLAEGNLHPVVGQVFAFEDAGQALATIERRDAVGKIVVAIQG